MKNRIASGSLVLAVICCALYFATIGFTKAQNSQSPKAQKKEAPKFALLIGINQYKTYPTDKVRDLRGTNNDVALMKNLLVGTYQFKADETPNSPVKTLLNAQATQEAIRSNFKTQLIDNAKSYFEKMATKDAKDGATVVFYYSGHGSKLPDQNGDETDEIDETIVPHDSTTNVQTQKDIRDDEFDVWFKELKNYTTNITFIFDSCHSGTVTRGGSSKSVDRQFPTKKNSRGGGQTLTDGINIPSEESYVTVSGSLPTEESQEDPDFVNPDTKQAQWNGALTYNFVTLLRQDPDITYREIINRIQPAVAGFRQTPQAEGDIDRTVFGSSASRGKTSVFMTTSRLAQKTFDGASQAEDIFIVTMTVGTIVGAGKDAALAVFGKKPGEKIRSQIGSGIVTTAADFKSTAEIVLFDKTIKEMPADAVVNIVSPNYSKGDKEIVALDTTAKKAVSDKGTEILSRIEEKLKTSQMLQTVRLNNVLASLAQPKNSASVKPEENWQVAVVRGSYKDFKFGNPQPDVKQTTSGKGDAGKCATTQFVADKAVEPADTQEGYFLVSKQGKMPLYNLWYAADNPNAGECLADALEKHARIENLRNLSSGGSKLNDEVKVEIIRLDAKDTERAKFEAEVQQHIQQCESNQAAVKENTGNSSQFKPGDLFYLKITNTSQRDLFVYLYTLTTSGAIDLLFPPEGSAKSEQLPAGKTICTIQKEGLFKIESAEKSPPGVETLKVIATKQEIPANLLTQPKIYSKGNGRFGNSPLNQLLKQTSAGSRSAPVAFGVDEWATKNINIEIVRP